MTISAKFVFISLAILCCLGRPIDGFAAKKKGGGKKNVASSAKGFGTKAPSFDEVVASFKTRMGNNAVNERCPCGSGLNYGDCCSPYHSGAKFPEVPLAVLKTRYSAFFFRLIPYIIATTHPVNRDFNPDKVKWAKELNKNGMFDSFEFVSLDPGEASPGKDDNEAFIEFRVKLRAKDGSREETIISEKSRFLSEEGKWLYASGEVRSEVAGLEDAVLNQ